MRVGMRHLRQHRKPSEIDASEIDAGEIDASEVGAPWCDAPCSDSLSPASAHSRASLTRYGERAGVTGAATPIGSADTTANDSSSRAAVTFLIEVVRASTLDEPRARCRNALPHARAVDFIAAAADGSGCRNSCADHHRDCCDRGEHDFHDSFSWRYGRHRRPRRPLARRQG
jgi:hypothetical protein